MNINNGFNTLPWYDSLTKQNHNKWYTYGQSWPLVCPQGYILPFQFICDTSLSISSNIYAINSNTGASIDLGIKPTVTEVIRPDITYYLVKLNTSSIQNLPIGRYSFQMNTSEGYLYSEEFTVVDNPSDYIKVEYWNEDNLKFTHGEINFEDDFRFILYINSTIGKPEYAFEEELTKRLGYKFIESQTSNKIYKFAFVAPEYICDAMRLIRMCDYIKITTKHDSYNALSFSYDPKWQEQGDLASVEVEFDTDCIIQKLESFNRRIKESFYNALLADIDEPILFSTDTVAQYYTEYTSVSSINGKLIRQLEALSQKELQGDITNIAIAVDNQSDPEQKAKKVFLQDILGLVDSVSKLFKGHYDEAGNLEWIEALSHIGVNGSVTMFIDNGTISLPSLYAGLPIDEKTIIRDENGVLMINPGIDLGGGLDETELTEFLTTNGYAKKSDIPSLNGYATQSWVEGKGYALSSDLTALSSKLNNFLEGSDTDTIINKWLELEAFLSGLSESDNLATILAGKIDKTYVDDNFVTIETAQSIIGEKNFTGGLKVNGSPITYNSTGKYWKLEGDLLVTGNVTMYGNDSDFVASTIMDAIAVDGTTISKEGGVLKVIGDLSGGATTLGELSNVGSWANSVASQDRIMYQAANSSMWVAKNLSDLAVGGVTGDYLPLSGGTLTGAGSDILTISRTLGNTLIKFLSNNILVGFLGVSNLGEPLFVDSGTVSHYLLHSGNYSSYALPLSGGTLTVASYENFVIKRNADNAFSGLTFSNRDEGVLGYIGIGGQNSNHPHQPCFLDASKTVHKIWHSGNDGSGSGLDADLLDGVHGSSYFTGVYDDTIDFNKFADGSYDNHFYYIHASLSQSNRPPISYGGLLNLGVDTMNAQIAMGNNSELWFRQRWWSGNGGNWSAWKQIAFTDSNVASATKLQTARTIWGQSFNGTGNVDGTLRIVPTTGLFTEGIRIQSYSNWSTIMLMGADGTAAGNGTTANSWGIFNNNGIFAINRNASTDNATNILCNINGNWGIGTLSPASKLAVNGTLTANISSSSVAFQAYRTNATNDDFGVDINLFAYQNKGLTIGGGGYGGIFGYYNGSTFNEILRLSSSGNVGIGTTNPNAKLHVNGRIQCGGMSALDGIELYHATPFIDFHYNNSSSDHTLRLIENTAGVLTIQGSIIVSGGITMYSDIRKKTKLQDVELSLKQIANAPLIEHYYNSDDKRTTHVGSIAQYWAGLNDWFCKLDNEGYYTMEIQNAALASAISIARELDRYENKTDKKIKQLKKRISQLEDEIERLKNNIN